MATFLALYRGESVGGSKLLALTADPVVVADFAARMLAGAEEPEPDAALRELEQGRFRALEIVRDEASGDRE